MPLISLVHKVKRKGRLRMFLRRLQGTRDGYSAPPKTPLCPSHITVLLLDTKYRYVPALLSSYSCADLILPVDEHTENTSRHTPFATKHNSTNPPWPTLPCRTAGSQTSRPSSSPRRRLLDSLLIQHKLRRRQNWIKCCNRTYVEKEYVPLSKVSILLTTLRNR